MLLLGFYDSHDSKRRIGFLRFFFNWKYYLFKPRFDLRASVSKMPCELFFLSKRIFFDLPLPSMTLTLKIAFERIARIDYHS